MISFGPAVLDRMVAAVEKVRDRLYRATAALERAGILYAVTGGNAVAAWVARVDPAAVRNTQDVDILLRPADLPNAIVAMELSGFIYRRLSGVDLFLDGEGGKVREAVKIHFAETNESPRSLVPNPRVADSHASDDDKYRLLRLEPLLEMLLSVFRTEDRMLARDLMDVGLVDESWLGLVHPVLAPRLKQILDDPDG